MSHKWKPKAASSTHAALPTLKGWHAHRCLKCGHRYEDGCSSPLENGTCGSCRHGTEWALWRTTRLPSSCCRDFAAPARPDQLAFYRLGGTDPWWVCPRCHRTHPFDPQEGTP